MSVKISVCEFTAILLAITAVSYADGNCPEVVNRDQWGSRVTATSTGLQGQPTHVIVHHSASPICVTQADCSAMVRSFQKVNMDTQQSTDIAYNFLIGEDGNIYEGVGWEKAGTHTHPNLNLRSIGICMIGEYSTRLPGDKALDALKKLIDCGVQSDHISANYKLLGHRQVRNTDCPGHTLHFHLRGWKNWSPAP